MDAIAKHVHVVDSPYGKEAACTEWGAWIDYFDKEKALREQIIEIERLDQVVLYFPELQRPPSEELQRPPSEEEVLEALGNKLYPTAPDLPNGVAVAFARTIVAPPSEEEPLPIRTFDKYVHFGDTEPTPPSAVVTLKTDKSHLGFAAALEAGDMCMSDDVRAQILEASTTSIPAMAIFDLPYVANLDGFQALAKASSKGTTECADRGH